MKSMHSSHSHTRLLVLLAATLLPLAGALRSPSRQNASSPPTASRRTGSHTGALTTSSVTARSTQINAGNVGKLGLAWSYATGTTRGLQATPIVVDGRMYTTGVWSVVYALDAKTGKPLWTFDPEVPACVGSQCLLRRREPRRGGVAGRASTSARSMVDWCRSTRAPARSAGK